MRAAGNALPCRLPGRRCSGSTIAAPAVRESEIPGSRSGVIRVIVGRDTQYLPFQVARFTVFLANYWGNNRSLRGTMRKTAAENTNFRLKAVLDVLAEGVLTGESQNAGEVLAEALVRVPLNAYEAELLSGGIPRGHKSLTTATAKLVKAGWLVKGRSGWTITEDGLRATVAFADADSFSAALDAGTPVPANTPLPVAVPATSRPPRRPRQPRLRRRRPRLRRSWTRPPS